MIITCEDIKYQKGERSLGFYADNPHEGLLEDIIFGDTFDELFANGENEGLFYQLYSIATGERIGSGVLDPDSPHEEIKDFEKSLQNKGKTIVEDKINEESEMSDEQIEKTIKTAMLCGKCLNSKIDSEMSANFDFSSFTIGKLEDGFRIMYESGGTEPPRVIFERWIEECKMWACVGTYYPKYCPECGRSIIEKY